MHKSMIKARLQERLPALKVIGETAALIFSAGIIFRWWYYINTYSVNLLVWDQWDLYEAFFKPHTWLEIFCWQHGPHRQGVGFFLTKIVADLSGWNTRIEAFAIGAIVFLAMVIALILKRRLINSLSWFDVAILLIFLTPLQWSIFASVPNLSHGSAPLLLLMCYCMAWTLALPGIRYATVLTLNFLLIYTGFGLSAGVLTPILLAGDCLGIHRYGKRQDLGWPLAGVLISLISAASFFIDYTFAPSVPNFQFPIPAYWQYPVFTAVMLANFFGVKGAGAASFITGSAIMLTMIWVCVFHLRHLARRYAAGKGFSRGSALDRIVVVLTTFTLLFCTFTAIGRISLGLSAGQASRYIPYLIPGFLGIYLHLSSRTADKLRPCLLAVTVFLLIAATFPLRTADYQTLVWLTQSKTRWKQAYLQSGSVEASNRATGFKVYPDAARTNLEQKLTYLKDRKLNLFQDAR